MVSIPYQNCLVLESDKQYEPEQYSHSTYWDQATESVDAQQITVLLVVGLKMLLAPFLS